MKRRILGMDISTTCTGVSILDYDDETNEKKILYIGSVKFKVPKNITPEESLFLKSKQFTNDFIVKYKDIGITDICIESPLVSSNNAITCLTLGRFNGMLSQAIYEATGIAPHYISSFDARKYGFPTLTSIRRYDKNDNQYTVERIRKSINKNELTPFGCYTYSTDKKYILWEMVDDMFKGIEWTYNKRGELKKENFDATDSLVASLGWLNKCKYGNTEPQITNYLEEQIFDEGGNKFIKITYTVNFCGEDNTKTMIF